MRIARCPGRAGGTAVWRAAPGPTQRQWARRPSHDSGSAGSMPVVASNDHRAAISVPAAARPPGPARLHPA